MLKKAKNRLIATKHFVQSLGKRKVFCVGQNKTGTTSLAKALTDLNIPVAATLRDHDPNLMRTIEEWYTGDYRRIIRSCRLSQGFQDYPFSLPGTYEALDRAFPKSKFVLTVRDSSEQWCNSFTSYYLKKYWAGEHPLANHASGFKHPYAENALRRMRLIYGEWKDPFDKIKLIHAYESQNLAVHKYFNGREHDLITINLSNDKDYKRLCDFLDKSPQSSSFPWINKTRIDT